MRVDVVAFCAGREPQSSSVLLRLGASRIGGNCFKKSVGRRNVLRLMECEGTFVNKDEISGFTLSTISNSNILLNKELREYAG